MSRSRWIDCMAFLYLLILLMPISNFAYSLIFTLVIITCVGSYKQIRTLQWRELHKPLVYTLIYFLGTIFLVSLPFGSEVIKETQRYLLWALPCLPLMLFAMQKDIRRVWQWAASIAGIVISIPVIYQSFILDEFRPGGFFTKANEMTIAIEFSVPIIVYAILNKGSSKYETMSRRVLAFISLLLTILSIGLGASRGGIIGLLIGGIVSFYLYIWKCWSHKFKTASLVALIIGASVFISCFSLISRDASRDYDDERLYFWESSYHMWQEHPILGVGFSNWQQQYRDIYVLPEAQERDVPQPHNMIAFFFSTTGIVGGVSFLVLMVSTVIISIRQYYKTREAVYLLVLWAFLSAYIHGMVDSGITNKSAMREFCAYYGIILGYLYYQKKIIADKNGAKHISSSSKE